MRHDRGMRGRLATGALTIGWRVGLLLLGLGLVLAAMRSALDGAGWPVFAVGLASGLCIALVALPWPRRSPSAEGIETGAFLLGCLAVAVVIVFLGRYGAASGAFIAMTGAYALASLRRAR
jgi:hypothetical protein